MCQMVMRETLELLPETNEQQFQTTMTVMAQNPAYAQMIMAAQQGKLPDDRKVEEAKAKPKLEKSLTLRAFEVSKRLTMEAMQKQAKQGPPSRGGDEMSMMIDMFVDQAKVEDALFIEQGVNNDELEEAIMYYIGSDDE